LAFSDDGIVNSSIIVILLAALLAGITGYILLKLTLKSTVVDE